MNSPSSYRCQQEEDEQLIVQMCLGEGRAFERLVERYEPRLSRLVEHLIGDKALVQDILQHVWLQLYRARFTLRPQGNLFAWLSEVARNRCVDELRSSRRKPLHFSSLQSEGQEDDESLLDLLPDPAPTPEEYLERDQVRQTIYGVIRTLSPPLRTVILLRTFGHLSYHEIGQRLQIPVATAKVRFYRARQALRSSPQLQEVWCSL